MRASADSEMTLSRSPFEPEGSRHGTARTIAAQSISRTTQTLPRKPRPAAAPRQKSTVSRSNRDR